MEKVFTAAKAFIEKDNKILLLRESSTYTNSGKYDVPGGRLEKGEDLRKGLIREIFEETGLPKSHVKIIDLFCLNDWKVPRKEDTWHIFGNYFVCEANSDKIVLSKDHDQHIWINPIEYKDYNIAERLFPVFEAYLKYKDDHKQKT